MLGYSGSDLTPPAKAMTGVWGYATEGGSSARGVIGETASGHGVHGIATSGYAGYFAGKVYTSKFIEMTEITDSAAPATSRGRLFLRDHDTGTTQLCVRFNTGALQVIATQP